MGTRLPPRRPQFRRLLRLRAAKEHACHLLHVGDDFTKTDIAGVL
jgi:hypothetical protein